ncbi:MAG TPA: MFS transporter [Actinomycetota bacterium]|nr:MFS transporter [Actinomycetota bacterium]
MNFSFFRALSQRDFALLWAGQTISLFGDGIFTIALAWQALELSGSATTLGLVLLVRGAARILILLVGGAVADRVERRALMLIGDSVQALAVAAVAYLLSTGQLHVWHLVVLGAITGAGSGILLAAATAVVPQLVTEEFLASANSLTSTSRLLAFALIGPAVGGILVAALGTTVAFSVDAASFLASIGALILIRPRALSAASKGAILSDVKEGFSYVRSRPWLWVTMLAVGTVGSFVAYGPLSVLVPLLVRSLHGGADSLGLVYAGFGVGGVAAAVVSGSVHLPRNTSALAFLGWVVSGLGVAALGLAGNTLTIAVLLAVVGFFNEAAQVIWVTLLQIHIPERLLGRISSIDWFVSLSLQPLGLGLAGPAAAALGVGGALVVGGTMAASAAGLGFLRPGVRDLNPV